MLQDAGKVTAEIAKSHAESEFEKYRVVQDRLFESDFDRIVAETKRLTSGEKPAARTTIERSTRSRIKPRRPSGRKDSDE